MKTKVGYSFEVDWWTLGALLIEMLSGNPPFTASNIQQLLQVRTRHRRPHTRPPPPPRIIVTHAHPTPHRAHAVPATCGGGRRYRYAQGEANARDHRESLGQCSIMDTPFISSHTVPTDATACLCAGDRVRSGGGASVLLRRSQQHRHPAAGKGPHTAPGPRRRCRRQQRHAAAAAPRVLRRHRLGQTAGERD
jgi:serine/threonine protein kinase